MGKDFPFVTARPKLSSGPEYNDDPRTEGVHAVNLADAIGTLFLSLEVKPSILVEIFLVEIYETLLVSI